MKEYGELASTPRDRFQRAAEKELAAFERREREFRKKEQRERAAVLPMLMIKRELTSQLA